MRKMSAEMLRSYIEDLMSVPGDTRVPFLFMNGVLCCWLVSCLA